MFGSSNNTTTTNNTSTIPAPYSQYIPQTLGAAWGIANNTPYTPYPGQQIAPLNSQETSSLQGIQNLQGAYQPLMNSAANLSQGAPTSYTPQTWNNTTAQQYMSPYTSQVNDAQNAELLRNAQINQQHLGGNAAQQNAFGGSRFGLEQSENARNLQTAQNMNTATNLNQAYNSGQGAFNTANQMGLSAAQFGNQGANNSAYTLGSLASQGQNLGITGANANLAAGQVAQNQAQNSLNLGYSNFQQQLNYPKDQLAWFNSIMSGAQSPTSNTSSTTTTPGASPFSQIAGLGIAGLGAYNSGLFG